MNRDKEERERVAERSRYENWITRDYSILIGPLRISLEANVQKSPSRLHPFMTSLLSPWPLMTSQDPLLLAFGRAFKPNFLIFSPSQVFVEVIIIQNWRKQSYGIWKRTNNKQQTIIRIVGDFNAPSSHRQWSQPCSYRDDTVAWSTVMALYDSGLLYKLNEA